MHNIITQKEDPELPCRRLNQGLGAHVNQELSFKHKKRPTEMWWGRLLLKNQETSFKPKKVWTKMWLESLLLNQQRTADDICGKRKESCFKSQLTKKGIKLIKVRKNNATKNHIKTKPKEKYLEGINDQSKYEIRAKLEKKQMILCLDDCMKRLKQERTKRIKQERLLTLARLARFNSNQVREKLPRVVKKSKSLGVKQDSQQKSRDKLDKE